MHHETHHPSLNPDTSPAANATSTSRERVRQITEEALDQLQNQLDAGNSDQLNAFLAAISRFHRYSFGNILLILSQRPDASRVAGFHTWRSLGRSVCKGEKGIAIYAPMVLRQKKNSNAGSKHEPTHNTRHESASNTDDDRGPPRITFRVVYVFDVSQTEGQPLPKPARIDGNPGEWLARLEDAVTASGIELVTSEDLGAAEGISSGGTIRLKAGLTNAARFSVLVHEWAHELLHQGKARESLPDQTVRETEAEAVAFVVSNAIGLEVGTASSDYIRLYQGDSKTLADSLDRIQRAAGIIIDAMTPQEVERPPANVAARSLVAARRQR